MGPYGAPSVPSLPLPPTSPRYISAHHSHVFRTHIAPPTTTMGEHSVSPPDLNLFTQLSASELQHQPCHMQTDDDTLRVSAWNPPPFAVSTAKTRTPFH
jgi:hypothetical protein